MDDEQARRFNGAVRTIGMRHRALAGAALNRIGLSIGQEALMMELSEQGPRTQTQLATAAGCEPPTITSAVQRLESLDLVSRHPSPIDRRATIVELTASGHAILGELTAAWTRLAEASVAGLSHTKIDELTAALTDLATSLQNATSDSV